MTQDESHGEGSRHMGHSPFPASPGGDPPGALGAGEVFRLPPLSATPSRLHRGPRGAPRVDTREPGAAGAGLSLRAAFRWGSALGPPRVRGRAVFVPPGGVSPSSTHLRGGCLRSPRLSESEPFRCLARSWSCMYLTWGLATFSTRNPPQCPRPREHRLQTLCSVYIHEGLLASY